MWILKRLVFVIFLRGREVIVEQFFLANYLWAYRDGRILVISFSFTTSTNSSWASTPAAEIIIRFGEYWQFGISE
jgi:hypothetical protein